MTSTEINSASKKFATLLGGKLKFRLIKTKLIVIIVTMLIVSGTTLTGVAAFMSSNAINKDEINTLMAVGKGTSEKLWLVTDMGKDFTSILAVDPDAISILERLIDGITVPLEPWNTLLEEETDLSEYFIEFQAGLTIPLSRLAVYDTNGIVVASSDVSSIGRDDSNQDFFSNQEKGAYVGEPFIDTGGVPVIPYAQPYYDNRGRQIGLAVICHEYSGFDKTVFTTPGIGDESTNFLVGPDGTILSAVNGDYSPFLTKKFDLTIFPPGENVVQAPGYYGHMEYIVKTPVPGTDWSIITTETVNEVNRPLVDLVMMMIASLLIVIAIGLFAAAFIANGFTRPIKALKENAEQLALGDADVVITHVGIDEIGQLADAFRHMIENIKVNADAVQKIASGNVNFKIVPASEKDMEGHAFIQMKGTLSSMTASLNTLARQAAEGDLTCRADATQFQGIYRNLIETLNEAFSLIVSPIQESMRLSVSYSSGDYSDRFDPDIAVKGDFEPFKGALNQIGINSSGALLKIRQGVHNISSAAIQASSNIEDIASAVSILAEGSSRVSSLSERNDTGLEQALTAMTDLANTVGEVAHRTTAVSVLASQSSDLAYDGVKRAELAGEGMEKVINSAEDIAASVAEMSNHMEEIGGIVDVITGIAEQISLLALNAAIEAARAGNAGLGFAVVADEVKSLAQDSHNSAEHIGSIIRNLQKMSGKITVGVEKAVDVVQSGSNAVNETITIFHQMAEAIADVNKNISEVAAASEEQAASVQEITGNMSEVQNMVQETTKEATDSAAAAEEISASLDELKYTAAQSAELAKYIEEEVNQFNIE